MTSLSGGKTKTKPNVREHTPGAKSAERWRRDRLTARITTAAITPMETEELESSSHTAGAATAKRKARGETMPLPKMSKRLASMGLPSDTYAASSCPAATCGRAVPGGRTRVRTEKSSGVACTLCELGVTCVKTPLCLVPRRYCYCSAGRERNRGVARTQRYSGGKSLLARPPSWESDSQVPFPLHTDTIPHVTMDAVNHGLLL